MKLYKQMLYVNLITLIYALRLTENRPRLYLLLHKTSIGYENWYLQWHGRIPQKIPKLYKKFCNKFLEKNYKLQKHYRNIKILGHMMQE